MKPTPTSVERLGESGIRISWSTGEVHEVSSKILRKHCPSATSRAERGDTSHEKPLTGRGLLRVVEHTENEQLQLEQIWAVGNYAIGMRWGDGHDSGIYHYDLLYKIATAEETLDS